MSPFLLSFSASVSGLSQVSAPIYVNNFKPDDSWQSWAFLHIVYDVVSFARVDGGSAVRKVSWGLERNMGGRITELLKETLKSQIEPG